LPAVIGITIPEPAKEVIAVVPATKEWSVIKKWGMRNPGRDLLVLFKHDFSKEQFIDKEIKYLNHILQQTETSLQFYKAHELVDRNYITTSFSKIVKAIRRMELKPFRFLINKN
jgi:hypothetical protein